MFFYIYMLHYRWHLRNDLLNADIRILITDMMTKLWRKEILAGIWFDTMQLMPEIDFLGFLREHGDRQYEFSVRIDECNIAEVFFGHITSLWQPAWNRYNLLVPTNYFEEVWEFVSRYYPCIVRKTTEIAIVWYRLNKIYYGGVEIKK